MLDDDIKALGLQARAFKLSLKGRQRPSNDLLYVWFVGQAQLVRKRDVLLFDVWLRSDDGIIPLVSANSNLHHSIFPHSSFSNKVTVVSLEWLVCEVTYKFWALTIGGHLELIKKANKLPSSSLLLKE